MVMQLSWALAVQRSWSKICWIQKRVNLPEEVVVQALEEAWLRINGMEPKYFHWLNVFGSHALASLWQSICEPFIVVLLFTKKISTAFFQPDLGRNSSMISIA
jgi:hypothetical protein